MNVIVHLVVPAGWGSCLKLLAFFKRALPTCDVHLRGKKDKVVNLNSNTSYYKYTELCEQTLNELQLVGKSFGCVDIDIECKNISISANIGGLILSTKYIKSGIPKTLLF